MKVRERQYVIDGFSGKLRPVMYESERQLRWDRGDLDCKTLFDQSAAAMVGELPRTYFPGPPLNITVVDYPRTWSPSFIRTLVWC